MNENIKNLVELIEKHPERKVIAMVEFEVVGSDDFSRWLGYIGKVKLEEIYQSDERVYYKSIDWDELLEEVQDNIYIDKREDGITDEELERLAEEEIEKLKWEEVIIVNIDN